LRRAKKKHRAFADTAGLYGVDIARIERTDYERFAGIWLNRHRQQVRQAAIVRSGVAAYFGTLTQTWFVHTCESIDEARFACDQYNASQARAAE
jgi:hypothetical protein